MGKPLPRALGPDLEGGLAEEVTRLPARPCCWASDAAAGPWLSFNRDVDGQQAPAIYLGRNSANPGSDPFTG